MSTLRSRRGMTLIEIVVALMIVAVLFAAVTFGVGALTGAKAQEASTELAGTIRALYDTAALSGRTCRLVFDLPEEKNEEGAVKWRAECAKGGVTATSKRDDELKELRAKTKDKVKDDKRFRRLDDDSAPTLQQLQEQEKDRVEEAAKFSDFSSEDVVEKTLPSNVRVEVWTQKQRQPAKTGTAYLYFFPQGYTERAQVWVRQGDNAWTLTISPLTGKTKIHGEDLEVPRT
ncbi:MAG: prepilin-type cleavage/methylation domain-containing protein [Archangium gephyra]|uniref:Prepilin-type cleavage/methylation domain-containing protein n=1 Tax=Archangium gephyra TaxID=48 RepID=A0A2W5SZG9_9BACT|nr:MAG: prepilin-type cleavage/methylation domain-containing protein [Archangium gephyra]